MCEKMLCPIHNQGNASFHTFLDYFCSHPPFSLFYCYTILASSVWCPELYPHHGPQEELLSCGIWGEAVLIIYWIVTFPRTYAPTLQHGAIMILCWVKRGLAPKWVPHFTFELPSSLFVDSSCYISFNPYDNSMQVRFSYSFHRWGNWDPKWSVTCLRSPCWEVELGFESSLSDLKACAFPSTVLCSCPLLPLLRVIAPLPWAPTKTWRFLAQNGHVLRILCPL